MGTAGKESADKVSDSLKIIGAHGKRRPFDYYATPPECTEALINFLHLDKWKVIWEPAAGEGNITSVLAERGYTVLSSDIQTGTDFLTITEPPVYDYIITNPPFSLAEQFIRKAASFKKPFAYLLKSQYWNSGKRRELFFETRPRYILPLTWRPDFTGQGASMMDVMWVVWGGYPEDYGTRYYPLKRPEGK